MRVQSPCRDCRTVSEYWPKILAPLPVAQGAVLAGSQMLASTQIACEVLLMTG